MQWAVNNNLHIERTFKMYSTTRPVSLPNKKSKKELNIYNDQAIRSKTCKEKFYQYIKQRHQSLHYNKNDL
mgnify:CR=1 FL=1